jgi:hypothetical protein
VSASVAIYSLASSNQVICISIRIRSLASAGSSAKPGRFEHQLSKLVEADRVGAHTGMGRNQGDGDRVRRIPVQLRTVFEHCLVGCQIFALFAMCGHTTLAGATDGRQGSVPSAIYRARASDYDTTKSQAGRTMTTLRIALLSPYHGGSHRRGPRVTSATAGMRSRFTLFRRASGNGACMAAP